MSSFTTPLIVTPLPDGKNWKLYRSFSYHVGSKYSKTVIKVPAGFVTDFASIPQFLIAVSGLLSLAAGNYFGLPWLTVLGIIAILAAALLPKWDKYGKAAVIHDYLYNTKTVSRKMADIIFLEAMDVLKVNTIVAHSMYGAVRLVGWLAWKRRK